jgi:hypothetical protein
MSGSAASRVLVVGASLIAAVLPAAAAGAIPKLPDADTRPQGRQWTGTVFLAGRLRVTSLFDPAAACRPGYRVGRILESRFSDRRRQAGVVIAEAPGSWSYTAAAPPARTSVVPRVTEFAPAAACPGQDGPPEAPAPESPPACRAGSGQLLSEFDGSDAESRGRLDLRGYPAAGDLMSVSGAFAHGQSVPADCVGEITPRLGGRWNGVPWFTRAGTAMSIVVPITPRMFFAMRRGQSLARRVTISGACYRPTLTGAAAATGVGLARSQALAPFPSAPPPGVRGWAAPDDPPEFVSCALDGEVWVILHRSGGTRTRY